MSGEADQAKGRIKEAAGALTGDDDLKDEGTTDRKGGEVKEKIGNVVDKAKDAVNDLTNRK